MERFAAEEKSLCVPEMSGQIPDRVKKMVIVAGATGFVGRALLQHLAGDYAVVGLTRQTLPQGAGDGVKWRRCDIFSLIQCEQALTGAHSAFYLVHSMLPSAHLTQGHFEDMDLILADNFARAARKAGLRQIIYLGGLIPPGEPHLSRHLQSRLEVEETLGSRGTPVTTLRAGLIVGSGGSSFVMLKAVVEHLFLVPCPKWSKSLTQPVALDDVLSLLRYALEHPAEHNRSFDIGSPDVLSYRDLLERLARHMGKRRIFFHVPGTSWCKPWLSLLSCSPMSLVSPLLESMRHSMVAYDLKLQREAGITLITLDEALRRAIVPGISGKKPHRKHLSSEGTYDVRSVQRIQLAEGRTARWLAEEYVEWLPRLFRFSLMARSDKSGSLTIWLRFPRLLLLELTFDRERSASSDRQLFYITGGLLVLRSRRLTQRPRLEFRQLLGGRCVLVAIHDYRPTIPWPLYNLTQAKAHLWVMHRFSRHIRNLG